jgi:transcriptional regulator with XRE-family HTH domain
MASDPFADGMAFFGSEVKRLRERAGMTQQELADAMHYSLDSIKSVETGRELGSEKFAQVADKIFGTEDQLQRLREFITRITMRPWFRDRMLVERKAAEILEYEPYGISGLLQTENYMRTMARGIRPVLSREQIDQAVMLRMTRQEILDRDDPPHLWVVMDESALHRTVGNAGIMREQRDHLVKMGECPNVTIQVIPNSQGVTSAFGRAFSVLSLESNSVIVYLEDVDDARYVRSHDRVKRYMRVFDHLRASALDDDRSADLIKGDGV